MRPTHPTPTTIMPTAKKVSTFVRIRPFTPKEKDAHDTELPALAADGSTLLGGGFTGVIGPTECNCDVFERCLTPNISLVLRGGSLSLFSYGYTGGGKTHTVVGYGEEHGLYFLAAERLLQELERAADGVAPDARPYLRVTACEIYDDKVYDLIGQHKIECSLRVDDDGRLQVVGAVSTEQLEGASTTGPGGSGVNQLATLVTRTSGLRAIDVHGPEHLQQIASSCVAKRAVGSSTEHTQSSRSHMLLRMEVTTRSLLDATCHLDALRAAAPALRNDSENAGAAGLADCFSGAFWSASGPGNCRDVVRTISGTCLGEVACTTASPLGDEMVWYVHADGDLEVDHAVPPGQRPLAFALKGYGGVQRTMDEWASELGAPGGACDFYATTLVAGSLVRLPVITRTPFDEAGEWERRFKAHEALKDELSAKLARNTRDIDDAKAAVAEAQARGGVSVGGTLLLADLGGADYDHRSGGAQKESAAINKSLLALKECLRALAAAPAKGAAGRPKFRDTKLTRMLEDSLAPNAASGRVNKESVSVMLVNVSPAASLEQPTLNAIRYGQLFTASTPSAGAAGRTGKGTISTKPLPSLRPQGEATAKPWMNKKAPTAAPSLS